MDFSVWLTKILRIFGMMGNTLGHCGMASELMESFLPIKQILYRRTFFLSCFLVAASEVNLTVVTAWHLTAKVTRFIHFHIPLVFVLYFPSQVQRFFSLLDTFSHLISLRRHIQHRVTVTRPKGQHKFRPLNEVKPCLAGLVSWMGDQIWMLKPQEGGGGGSLIYAKVDKMLIVSGTNLGFWSHFGCWQENITILSVKVSFRVHSKK